MYLRRLYSSTISLTLIKDLVFQSILIINESNLLKLFHGMMLRSFTPKIF